MTMPTSEYIEHQCTMQCAPNCIIQGASYIRSDLADTLAKAARDYISGPLDDFGSGDRLRAALSAYEAATKGEPKQP